MFYFHSSTCSCPVFPAPFLFIEEAVFAPLCILASFDKNKVPISAWVYFWAVYLVPPYIFVGDMLHSLWNHDSPTDQGSNLCPLQWQWGVLTPGPPAKSCPLWVVCAAFHWREGHGCLKVWPPCDADLGDALPHSGGWGEQGPRSFSGWAKLIPSLTSPQIGSSSHEACNSLLLFSCSFVFDSLWPHELQQARLPCLSLSPSICSNSCPSSRWCHPTISSCVVPFPSCLQSFPASASFPMRRLYTASVLPMNIQGWFPFGLTGLILQSKGLSSAFSSITVLKHQFFGTHTFQEF